MPIRQGGIAATSALSLPRATFGCFSVAAPASSTPCSASGSNGALLHRRPLRTVHESHPSYGSSHSSAPRGGTEQLDGFLHGVASLEVGLPIRIVGVGLGSNLDVPGDRYRHGPKQT